MRLQALEYLLLYLTMHMHSIKLNSLHASSFQFISLPLKKVGALDYRSIPVQSNSQSNSHSFIHLFILLKTPLVSCHIFIFHLRLLNPNPNPNLKLRTPSNNLQIGKMVLTIRISPLKSLAIYLEISPATQKLKFESLSHR